MPRANSKNPKARVISVKSALSALSTLIQYGRQSYKQEYHPGVGQCLGMALSKCDIRGNTALAIAVELLEDQNAHRLSHIVSKLLAGEFKLDEKTKTVTITLDY